MDALLKQAQNTFSSLSIRNYRLYFIGQAISLSGTWMQTVALGWLVLQITGSGTQLGLVTAAQFLPMLFFGPWGGVVVDRWNKRTLLIWTQVLFGIFAGILAALVFWNIAALWMIYTLALILGFVRIFDNPARQTFVSEMVPESYVKNAVSLNATENNLARAVGPSIGGLLIAFAGVAACFLFNAISYIAVIIMLIYMREDELHLEAPVPKKPGQLMEGLRYARGNPLIRDVLIMMAVIGTFAYEFQVSLPILAQNTFQSGAAGYAALMTAFGIGAVIGGVFTAGRTKIAPRQLVVASFFFGISIIITSLAASLTVAIIGMVIVGIFSINVTSLGNTMIQLEATPSMRGRVMALWSVAMIGSTPVGGPIIGAIGEHIGARWGLAVGGIASILTVLYAFTALMRKDTMRKVPEKVKIESDEASIGSVKVQ